MKLFVSYSRDDEAFVRRLTAALDGLDVWVDVERLRPGKDWSDSIHAALDACEMMLLIISPTSMASRNVADEWKYYHSQNKPIIPVLIEASNMHFQLSRIQYVDFRDITFETAVERLRTEIERRRGTGTAVDDEAPPPMTAGPRFKPISTWTAPQVRELAILTGHTDWVWRLDFSPDGQTLASGSYDKTARLWHVTQRREISVLGAHEGRVLGVRFSPDGKQLATASSDWTACLWNMDTYAVTHKLNEHTYNLYDVDYSPDGNTVATASSDHTVRLWDARTGECVHTLPDHGGEVWSVRYVPQGDLIATGTGSGDDMLRLWQTDRFDEPAARAKLDKRIAEIDFSPDGKLIAVATSHHRLRLFNLASGTEPEKLKGHEGSIRSVAFSDDGALLASAADDQTVRIWEVGSGKPLAVLKGHTDRVRSVRFAPNNRLLASASDDRTVRLWGILE